MCSAGGIDCAVSSVLAARESALRTEVSFAIAAKQQDAVKQQGDALTELLEQAAQLSKSLVSGQRFDAVG
jgi:hypothetical protein